MFFDSLKITITSNKAYPKYVQLRDQLEAFIRVNQIPADTQLPDILTLGRLAGLSNRSVERACTLLINDGVCFRRPKKGTFVRGGRPPCKDGMPRVCAILNPGSSAQIENDDILGTIYRGIQEKAQEEEIDIIILSERSIPVYRENFQGNLLGIIILAWYDVKLACDLVAKYPDQRFVFLNFHFPAFEKMPPSVTGIFNDDFAGGFAVGDYVCSHGCKKLQILSLKQKNDNYRRRIDGICRAAHFHGVDIPQEAIAEMDPRPHADDGQFAIAREFIHGLVGDKVDFDAVCCTNDLLAAGVAATLESLGMREQVMVFGYDNIRPYLSYQSHFPTVLVNLEEMGKRAISVLVANEPLPQSINVPPQLIFRDGDR